MTFTYTPESTVKVPTEIELIKKPIEAFRNEISLNDTPNLIVSVATNLNKLSKNFELGVGETFFSVKNIKDIQQAAKDFVNDKDVGLLNKKLDVVVGPESFCLSPASLDHKNAIKNFVVATLVEASGNGEISKISVNKLVDKHLGEATAGLNGGKLLSLYELNQAWQVSA